MTPLFSPNDQMLVESLSYDPEAEPSFEMLKGCLIWADERPEGLTPLGYETLCDLWIARGMLHTGRDLDDLPTRYREIWTEAHRAKLRWPGFRRVELSEVDREYLAKELAAMGEDEGL